MNKKGNRLTRQDVPVEYRWRLEDIYPCDEQWEKDFKNVRELLVEMAVYRDRLVESGTTLLEALRLEDRIQELGEKLFAYARMRRDENNTNPVYQAMSDRAENLSVQIDTELSFMDPDILTLTVETLDHLREEEKGLELYSFFLENLLRQKPHVLSTWEEKIIARSGDIMQAPTNIFRMLNDADLTFPPVLDEENNEVEVTHGRYTQLMESKDRRLRRDTFNSLYSSYGKMINTLAATYSSSVKKDVFYSGVRKYPSALANALFDDNVKVEVYDNLIGCVRSNLDKMHRYVSLRKKMLQLDEIHMYDLYVPMVKNVDWKISYLEAVLMVKEGLAPLGDDYVNTISKGIESGWVDVYENKGKTSGAYSWGPYGVHPYILMNYQDNLNSVFTLAHELGHAMHSYYSDLTQPYVYSHYKIFTAEVASTINESLLMDCMLKRVTERDKKLYLLNHYLEQFRGTIYRQTMFAEFEKIIHQKVEGGESLTAELLGQIYYRLNVDYYGSEMVVDQEIALEWARIPHFYSAFYVYKYSTGFSAATALTSGILKKGKPAVDRYLNFLTRGGSGYPLNLLKDAGVDMTTSRPVQEALDLFGTLLEQMEELTLRG